MFSAWCDVECSVDSHLWCYQDAGNDSVSVVSYGPDSWTAAAAVEAEEPVAAAVDGTAKHSCSLRVLFHAPVPHCPLCSVAESDETKQQIRNWWKKKKLEIRISLIKMLTHFSTYYLAMKPLDLKRLSNFQKIRKIFILYIDLDFDAEEETNEYKKQKRKERKEVKDEVKKLNESNIKEKSRRNF